MRALEDLVDVTRRSAEQVAVIGGKRDQSSFDGEDAEGVDHGQPRIGSECNNPGALFGPAVEDTNVTAVGPAESRETVAERNEKSVILLSGPRLDKADARSFDLGRGLVPGHRQHAGEQQKIAAFHWFNSPERFPSGTRSLVRQMLAP